MNLCNKLLHKSEIVQQFATQLDFNLLGPPLLTWVQVILRVQNVKNNAGGYAGEIRPV